MNIYVYNTYIHTYIYRYISLWQDQLVCESAGMGPSFSFMAINGDLTEGDINSRRRIIMLVLWLLSCKIREAWTHSVAWPGTKSQYRHDIAVSWLQAYFASSEFMCSGSSSPFPGMIIFLKTVFYFLSGYLNDFSILFNVVEHSLCLETYFFLGVSRLFLHKPKSQ